MEAETVEQKFKQILKEYHGSLNSQFGISTREIYEAMQRAYSLGQQSKEVAPVEDLIDKIKKLIDLQERSAVRYKACFGEENPGGEQIYQYFAMQLKNLLPSLNN